MVINTNNCKLRNTTDTALNPAGYKPTLFCICIQHRIKCCIVWQYTGSNPILADRCNGIVNITTKVARIQWILKRAHWSSMGIDHRIASGIVLMYIGSNPRQDTIIAHFIVAQCLIHRTALKALLCEPRILFWRNLIFCANHFCAIHFCAFCLHFNWAHINFLRKSFLRNSFLAHFFAQFIFCAIFNVFAQIVLRNSFLRKIENG